MVAKTSPLALSTFPQLLKYWNAGKDVPVGPGELALLNSLSWMAPTMAIAWTALIVGLFVTIAHYFRTERVRMYETRLEQLRALR